VKLVTLIIIILVSYGGAFAQQSSLAPLGQLTESTHTQAPLVLCIDEKGKGSQPSAKAYNKAAANGFRSVVTLRSPDDGVDLVRERLMVEQAKLRYFNFVPTGPLPKAKQVNLFLAYARDPANHPMLVNCAFAERVAPYMLIFRVVAQRWTKEKAMAEAAASGVNGTAARNFLDEFESTRRKSAATTREPSPKNRADAM